MKKVLALACSCAFALSLAACGTSGNGNNNGNNTGSNGSSLQSSVESTVDNLTDGMMQNSSTAKITADDAKAAALGHAGLTEADVTELTVDLDRDDGVLKYEVDFHHGGTEYDYDINAENGDIISYDKDRD